MDVTLSRFRYLRLTLCICREAGQSTGRLGFARSFHENKLSDGLHWVRNDDLGIIGILHKIADAIGTAETRWSFVCP